MSEYEQAVFVSYAWGGEREEIVNQIDQALQKRGVKIIRDKRELGYKGSISEFMERIGQGNCVVVVISDKYLRSKNCMYELVEIAENKKFADRIFPIVLEDAKIYDAGDRVTYVDYWDTEKAKLTEKIRGLRDLSNLTGINEELNDYDRFRDEIDRLATILKDLNSLTPDMLREADFKQLYDAIVQRVKYTTAGASTLKEASTPKKESKPMDTEKKDGKGSVNSARIKGDQNMITGNISSGGIAFQGGRHKNITINQPAGPAAGEIAALFNNIYKHIEARPPDPNVEKEEIIETVQKIQEEAAKGEKEANETKLTRWINSLNDLAPDIIDVALASLGGPVSGITAILKKIADRARQQAQS